MGLVRAGERKRKRERTRTTQRALWIWFKTSFIFFERSLFQLLSTNGSLCMIFSDRCRVSLFSVDFLFSFLFTSFFVFSSVFSSVAFMLCPIDQFRHRFICVDIWYWQWNQNLGIRFWKNFPNRCYKNPNNKLSKHRKRIKRIKLHRRTPTTTITMTIIIVIRRQILAYEVMHRLIRFFQLVRWPRVRLKYGPIYPMKSVRIRR